MPEIEVISFDGLNRSGKGTQIKRMKNYLEDRGITTYVLRGDGSRKGDGSENDPYSEWWKEMQPRLRNKDQSKDSYDKQWAIASDRLNWELYHTYHHEIPAIMDIGITDKATILLDRSLISRLFVRQRKDAMTTLDGLLTFSSPSGEEHAVVLPDISFILHAPKEELLGRNRILSDHPDKYEFRKKIITEHYESFERTVWSIAHPLMNLVHIEGNYDKDDVFREILRSYAKMRGEPYV
ncbi:MAG: hypothetical protein V1729_03815 [Candidatus Woesearchaeota archaeon]